jgi:hypothetical protein
VNTWSPNGPPAFSSKAGADGRSRRTIWAQRDAPRRHIAPRRGRVKAASAMLGGVIATVVGLPFRASPTVGREPACDVGDRKERHCCPKPSHDRDTGDLPASRPRQVLIAPSRPRELGRSGVTARVAPSGRRTYGDRLAGSPNATMPQPEVTVADGTMVEAAAKAHRRRARR